MSFEGVNKKNVGEVDTPPTLIAPTLTRLIFYNFLLYSRLAIGYFEKIRAARKVFCRNGQI